LPVGGRAWRFLAAQELPLINDHARDRNQAQQLLHRWFLQCANSGVVSFVPATAARATHQRAADAEPVNLMRDERWVVVAGFVPGHSPDSVISVCDAAGVLITEWAHESNA
jgi:hypothetical protein